MTTPANDHARARALEIVDAARVAINTHRDVEIAAIPKRIWDLVAERALPLVVSESDVAQYIGQFLDAFDGHDGDWPHRAEDGRYYVSRIDGDEDAGDYLVVDRRHAFATHEDCERYIVAAELHPALESLAEQVAPEDMPEPDFEQFLDRLGCAEINAFREARVGSVDLSTKRAA